jgi:acyl-coenzyme A synthetase/AMP-(fatty) acid ligase
MDEEGYLYFIGRSDDMIKVSGYRVSPLEVEEVVHATGLVREAVAFGVPHPQLGQAIVLLALPQDPALAPPALLKECQRRLPAWMVPAHVALHAAPFPRNPNGKIDRKLLRQSFLTMFESPQ